MRGEKRCEPVRTTSSSGSRTQSRSENPGTVLVVSVCTARTATQRASCSAQPDACGGVSPRRRIASRALKQTHRPRETKEQAKQDMVAGRPRLPTRSRTLAKHRPRAHVLDLRRATQCALLTGRPELRCVAAAQTSVQTVETGNVVSNPSSRAVEGFFIPQWGPWEEARRNFARWRCPAGCGVGRESSRDARRRDGRCKARCAARRTRPSPAASPSSALPPAMSTGPWGGAEGRVQASRTTRAEPGAAGGRAQTAACCPNEWTRKRNLVRRQGEAESPRELWLEGVAPHIRRRQRRGSRR